MQKFKTLADAIALAEFAHRNQTDKAGLPYIEHPKRVLETVKAQGALPYVQMAAILHDVTEDTAFTSDMLLDLGFSEATVRIVRLLDRGRSEKIYQNTGDHIGYYIHGEQKWLPGHMIGREDKALTKDEYYYAAIVAAGRDAIMVKLADIRDNMATWRLAYLPDDTQKRLIAKYTKALEILNPAPVNHGIITDWRHDPYTLR
jgi:(p)ppGpp synthase/HD superfamily hydrolase